jgi:hypothetical protein
MSAEGHMNRELPSPRGSGERVAEGRVRGALPIHPITPLIRPAGTFSPRGGEKGLALGLCGKPTTEAPAQ